MFCVNCNKSMAVKNNLCQPCYEIGETTARLMKKTEPKRLIPKGVLDSDRTAAKVFFTMMSDVPEEEYLEKTAEFMAMFRRSILEAWEGIK